MSLDFIHPDFEVLAVFILNRSFGTLGSGFGWLYVWCSVSIAGVLWALKDLLIPLESPFMWEKTPKASLWEIPQYSRDDIVHFTGRFQELRAVGPMSLSEAVVWHTRGLNHVLALQPGTHLLHWSITCYESPLSQPSLQCQLKGNSHLASPLPLLPPAPQPALLGFHSPRESAYTLSAHTLRARHLFYRHRGIYSHI